MILLLCLVAGVGLAMLYSAANGSWEPWAMRQAIRFAVGMVILLSVAVVDIRFWLRYAYVFYFVSLFLLAAPVGFLANHEPRNVISRSSGKTKGR